MKTKQATLDHFRSDDNLTGLMSNDLLACIASGEIDYQRMAQIALAGRGCDQTGKWVGFPQAKQIFEITGEF
ncbi:hypothetical protein [Spirosoma areae]